MATIDPTTNYSWDLPTVSGSSGAWGTALNAIFGDDATGIDAVVYAISQVANAALPKAGGTLTGALAALTQTWTHSALGNISSTQSFDLAAANSFNATVTGPVTVTLDNVPSGAVYMTVELTNGGSSAITWPASVLWPGGSEPSWTTAGVDIATFYTRDGGTTWYGALALADCS